MDCEQAQTVHPVQPEGRLLQRFSRLHMQPASGWLAALLGQCPDQLIRRTVAGVRPGAG